MGHSRRGDDERRRRARRRLERREDVGVVERVVNRLGQVERVIVVVVMRPVVCVMMVIIIVVGVVIMIVVVLVVVMMELESEEGVRMLVIAAGVRVRDDARTGDGRRGKEGRQNGSNDVPAQTHDVGLLPHRLRTTQIRWMRPPRTMPCGMPLALTHSLPGAYARPRRSPVLRVAISRRA